MRATIRDIAEKAGLSVATVSMVLNDKPSRISQATRQRVLQIAQELRYRPNRAAVRLKSNRSGIIGLVVSAIRNDFYANFAQGMESACRQRHWNVLLCNTGDSYQRESEYIQVLESHGVDGVALGMSSTGSAQKAQKTVSHLTALGIPTVLFDLSFGHAPCNAVVLDHQAGGYLATKHLLELGHRRIACITGPQYLEGSASRLRGCRQALQEYGLPQDPALISPGDYSMEGGRQAMEALLDKGATAVFAFNDMMAFGVCQCLRSHNISIPRDISVVGYDDVLLCGALNPPLTTIRQPVYEMGCATGDLLIDIIQGKAEPPVIKQYQPQLILRDSTGPCRG